MKFKNFLICCGLSLVLFSCQTKPISELSQDEGIEKIRENYKKENWSDLIANVDEYKARYPYSKNNIEAEVLQADAYYQSDKYPEALVAYDDFIRKNAVHDKVPFAHFRVAKVYDLQAPEQIDREQAFAKKAILKYQDYLRQYPNGEFISEAKERLANLKRRLAEHDLFVARFYWNKELFSAALSRYLNIIKTYPQYADLKKEAIENAAQCYEELAKILEKDPKSDSYVYFNNTTPEELRKKSAELRSN